MFKLKRKTVQRKDIPQNKDSLYLYDNYEEVCKKVTDPSLVTDAIFKEHIRDFLIEHIKNEKRK